MYLDRGEVAVDELGDSLLPGRELLADLAVLEAAVDLGPVDDYMSCVIRCGTTGSEALRWRPWTRSWIARPRRRRAR